VQLVVLVEDQVSCVVPPVETVESALEKVSCGAAAGVTLTATVRFTLPPAPLQVSVKLAFDVGETLKLPLVAREPDQLPLALQVLVLVELQFNVVDWPAVIALGEAPSVTTGAGVGGAVTLTDAVRVTLPPAPLHVSA
jgi:hypothetical protein